MTRSICLAIVLAASLPVAAQSQGEGEAAIRRIVAEQATAWNPGDGDAYAKRVSPDAAFTNLFGMVNVDVKAAASAQQ